MHFYKVFFNQAKMYSKFEKTYVYLVNFVVQKGSIVAITASQIAKVAKTIKIVIDIQLCKQSNQRHLSKKIWL